MKGFQRRSDFSLQNRIASLSNFAALRSKDPRFFSYLPIENLDDWTTVGTVVQSERGNQQDGCGWHVRILLRITLARKPLDFDFLRGLAPGRSDGFSIGRYEKNRGSLDLNAAKFESETIRFWREKSLRRWNPFKTSFHPCLSIIQNSQRRTQIHSKSFKKPLLRQKDDYIPQVK